MTFLGQKQQFLYEYNLTITCIDHDLDMLGTYCLSKQMMVEHSYRIPA